MQKAVKPYRIVGPARKAGSYSSLHGFGAKQIFPSCSYLFTDLQNTTQYGLCNMLSFGLRLYSQFSYKIIPIHHLYVQFK